MKIADHKHAYCIECLSHTGPFIEFGDEFSTHEMFCWDCIKKANRMLGEDAADKDEKLARTIEQVKKAGWGEDLEQDIIDMLLEGKELTMKFRELGR